MHVRWLSTPIGAMVAAATDGGRCLLEFADRRALEAQIGTLRTRLRSAAIPAGRGTNPHLDQLEDELAEYFAGARKRFSVELLWPGTPFEQSVWRRMLTIPAGETISYEQLGRDVGRARAQRAVGRACGANRIGIIIPCHRVVRKNGELRGYGGGLWRKKWLLEHERMLAGPAAHPPAVTAARVRPTLE
jgi:AraC family transcriptional regulator of adaptative response/methylated-DNA-[protein]-cysteine methyltransferase